MKNFKRYVPVVLIIIQCLLIAFFSTQGKKDTTIASRSVVGVVLEATDTKNITKPQYDKVEFFVRKVAHFVLYLFLGIYAYLSAGSVKIKHKALASLLFCLLFATSDELNQKFSSERAGEFTDILLDFISSSLGTFVTFLSIKKLSEKKYEKF